MGKEVYQQKITKLIEALQHALDTISNKHHALDQSCKLFLQQLKTKIEALNKDIASYDNENIFQLMDLEQKWQEYKDSVQDQINNLDFNTSSNDKQALSAKELLNKILIHIQSLFDLQGSVQREFYKKTEEEVIRRNFIQLQQLINPFIKDKPKCFISYAWGIAEHERLAQKLAGHLQLLGLEVWLDVWDNPAGSYISHFTTKIQEANYVILLGSKKLVAKYNEGKKLYDEVQAKHKTLDFNQNNNVNRNYIVNKELRLIFKKDFDFPRSIISLLLDGDLSECLPNDYIQDCVPVHFTHHRNTENYCTGISDLLESILPHNKIKDLVKKNLLTLKEQLAELDKYSKTKKWKERLFNYKEVSQSEKNIIIEDTANNIVGARRYDLYAAASAAIKLNEDDYSEDLQKESLTRKVAKNQSQPANKDSVFRNDFYIKIEGAYEKLDKLVNNFNIINIYGKKGIGKTTLIDNYLKEKNVEFLIIDASSKEKIYYFYWKHLYFKSQQYKKLEDDSEFLKEKFFDSLEKSNKKVYVVYDNVKNDIGSIVNFIINPINAVVLLISTEKLNLSYMPLAFCEFCFLDESKNINNDIIFQKGFVKNFLLTGLSESLDKKVIKNIIKKLEEKKIGFLPFLLNLIKKYYISHKKWPIDIINSFNNLQELIKLFFETAIEGINIDLFFIKKKLAFFSFYIAEESEKKLLQILENNGLVRCVDEITSKYEIHFLVREMLLNGLGAQSMSTSGGIRYLWKRYLAINTQYTEQKLWIIENAISLLKVDGISSKNYGLINAIVLHISYWCYGYSVVGIGAMEEALIAVEIKNYLRKKDNIADTKYSEKYTEKYILLLSALAFVYMETSNFNKSLAYFNQASEELNKLQRKKSLSLNILRKDLERNYAHTLFRAGYYEQAAEVIKQCIDKSVINQNIFYAINYAISGIIQHRIGNFQQAKNELEIALEAKKLYFKKKPNLIFDLELAVTKSNYAMCLCSYYLQNEKIDNNQQKELDGLLVTLDEASSCFKIGLGISDHRYLLTLLRLSYVWFARFLFREYDREALSKAMEFSEKALKLFQKKLPNNSYIISSLLWDCEIKLVKYIFIPCSDAASEVQLLQSVVSAMEQALELGFKWYEGRFSYAIKNFRNQNFYKKLIEYKEKNIKPHNINFVNSYFERIVYLSRKIFGDFNYVNYWYYSILELLSSNKFPNKFLKAQLLQINNNINSSENFIKNTNDAIKEIHVSPIGSPISYITLYNCFSDIKHDDIHNIILNKNLFVYHNSNYIRTYFLSCFLKKYNNTECYKIWLCAHNEDIFNSSLEQLKEQIKPLLKENGKGPGVLDVPLLSRQFVYEIIDVLKSKNKIIIAINDVDNYLIVKDFLCLFIEKMPEKILICLTTSNQFLHIDAINGTKIDNIDAARYLDVKKTTKENLQKHQNKLKELFKNNTNELYLLYLLNIHAIEFRYFPKEFYQSLKDLGVKELRNDNYFSIDEKLQKDIYNEIWSYFSNIEIENIFNRFLLILSNLYQSKSEDYFSKIITGFLNKDKLSQLRSIIIHVVAILEKLGVFYTFRDKLCLLKFASDYYKVIEFNYSKALLYKQKMFDVFLTMDKKNIDSIIIKNNIINDLAELMFQTGNYIQAIVYYRVVKSEREYVARAWSALGYNYRALIMSLNGEETEEEFSEDDVSSYNYGIGEFSAAIEMYKKIYKDTKKSNEQERALVINYIAMCKLRMGHIEKAKKEFDKIFLILKDKKSKISDNQILFQNQSIEIKNKIKLISNYLTIRLLYDYKYNMLEDEKESIIANQKKVLELAKSIYGKNHIMVAIARARFARIYCYLREYRHCIDWAKQSLRIYKNYYTEDHPRALTAYLLLSDAEFSLANYIKSYEYLSLVKEFGFRTYGKKISHILENRGYLHSENSDGFRKFYSYEKGKEFISLVMEIFGKNHIRCKKLKEVLASSQIVKTNIVQSNKNQGNTRLSSNLSKYLFKKLKRSLNDNFKHIFLTNIYFLTQSANNDVFEKNAYGATLFYELCRYGNLNALRIATNGLNKDQIYNLINTPTNYSWYPIMIACQFNHVEVVKFIISYLPDIQSKKMMLNVSSSISKYKIGSYKTSDRRSHLCYVDAPLYWAIINMNKELVNILLEEGANPTYVLNNGHNVISLCIQHNIDVIDLSKKIPILDLLLNKLSTYDLYNLITHEYGRFDRNIFYNIIEKFEINDVVKLLSKFCKNVSVILEESRGKELNLRVILKKFCEEYNIDLFVETNDRRYSFQLPKSEQIKLAILEVMYEELVPGLSCEINFDSLCFILSMTLYKDLTFSDLSGDDRDRYRLNRLCRLLVSTNYLLEINSKRVLKFIDNAELENYFYGNPVVYEIVFGGNVQIMKMAKDIIGNIHHINLRIQWSTLMLAAWRNNPDMIDYFIFYNSSDDNLSSSSKYINQQNSYGYESALYWAIVNRNIKLTKYLLNKGAFISDKVFEPEEHINPLIYMPVNGNDFTSLIHLAAKFGSENAEILKAILKVAQIKTIDFADGRFSSTPLCVAIRNNQHAEAIFLLEQKSNMLTLSTHGRTGYDFVFFATDKFKNELNEYLYKDVDGTRTPRKKSSYSSFFSTETTVNSDEPSAKRRKVSGNESQASVVTAIASGNNSPTTLVGSMTATHPNEPSAKRRKVLDNDEMDKADVEMYDVNEFGK